MPYGTSYPSGTKTNDVPVVGAIGERITGQLLFGSATSLTTATAKTVVSIVLTPGDWELTGFVGFEANAATSVTIAIGSISPTDNNIGGGANSLGGYAKYTGAANVGFSPILTLSPQTIRVASGATTTMYLVAQSTFTVNTMTAYGWISALRVR